MKIIDWLLDGDIVIQHLTNRYLLGRAFDHEDKGYIARYLELYNAAERGWGGSVYSNKWICSTYTLLELKYMEIHPENPCYRAGAERALESLWKNKGKRTGSRFEDMCVSAMLLSLVCYGKISDSRINEIVDYILAHQMVDGGWNCAWDSTHNRSTVGSVHTTISVLEALADYKNYGYKYRLDEASQKAYIGQEFLLRRNLFKSLTTGEPIHREMIRFHYPCRWKYDCFRALEYFAQIGRTYDARMQDALNLTKAAVLKGGVNRGTSYAGKIHFPLESGAKGRFNTYRALFILKYYVPDAYETTVHTEFAFK